jgi:hypothetical protein
MKFLCFGYLDANQFAALSESERQTIVDECMAYDNLLRKNGHFAGGEVLQGPQTARTLRRQGGKVRATDGPYAETKEAIGGMLSLEARDIDHAIELMSQHPGLKIGPFEIRPVGDLANLIRESERRRAAG